jgi:hypothetical protein
MQIDSPQTRSLLEFRQEQLRNQVNHALDLVQGSLHKNPGRRGYRLTTKVKQRTLTRYVRKRLVPRVRVMTDNHRKVRQLLVLLSEINWQLLQLPPQD